MLPDKISAQRRDLNYLRFNFHYSPEREVQTTEDQECTKENAIFSDSLLDISSEGPGGFQHIQQLNPIAALGLSQGGLADCSFSLSSRRE